MFQIMFFAGSVFTILFVIFTIIIFVKNNVGKLIGDVTGRNVRKIVNKRGAKKNEPAGAIEDMLKMPDDTARKTELLTGQENGLSNVFMDRTESVLADDTEILFKEDKKGFYVFEVEEEVTVVHTDECIEMPATWLT